MKKKLIALLLLFTSKLIISSDDPSKINKAQTAADKTAAAQAAAKKLREISQERQQQQISAAAKAGAERAVNNTADFNLTIENLADTISVLTSMQKENIIKLLIRKITFATMSDDEKQVYFEKLSKKLTGLGLFEAMGLVTKTVADIQAISNKYEIENLENKMRSLTPEQKETNIKLLIRKITLSNISFEEEQLYFKELSDKLATMGLNKTVAEIQEISKEYEKEGIIKAIDLLIQKLDEAYTSKNKAIFDGVLSDLNDPNLPLYKLVTDQDLITKTQELLTKIKKIAKIRNWTNWEEDFKKFKSKLIKAEISFGSENFKKELKDKFDTIVNVNNANQASELKELKELAKASLTNDDNFRLKLKGILDYSFVDSLSTARLQEFKTLSLKLYNEKIKSLHAAVGLDLGKSRVQVLKSIFKPKPVVNDDTNTLLVYNKVALKKAQAAAAQAAEEAAAQEAAELAKQFQAEQQKQQQARDKATEQKQQQQRDAAAKTEQQERERIAAGRVEE